MTPADLAGHGTIIAFSRGGLLEWRFEDGGGERSEKCIINIIGLDGVSTACAVVPKCKLNRIASTL